MLKFDVKKFNISSRDVEFPNSPGWPSGKLKGSVFGKLKFLLETDWEYLNWILRGILYIGKLDFEGYIIYYREIGF